jgi:hypothetical protein
MAKKYPSLDGIAAALAVKTRCDLIDVDITSVHGALAKQGVRYH